MKKIEHYSIAKTKIKRTKINNDDNCDADKGHLPVGGTESTCKEQAAAKVSA